MFELRMEITLQLFFVFARHCDIFLLRYNYVICLFDVVTFFDNVRVTLYSGTFELRLEITLQLRYVFARYCEVIIVRHNDLVLLRHSYIIYLFDVVTLELRYILVRLNYVWKKCYNYVIYLFVVVTFSEDVRITLYFSTSELRTEIML